MLAITTGFIVTAETITVVEAPEAATFCTAF